MDVTGQPAAYIIEQLPREPQLALLPANDRTNAFSRTMLAPSEIARCRATLQQTRIDWVALGYDDHTLTSSPRLKPGDSNPFMLREQPFGGGAVIPRGFLLVPASVSLQHPRVLQLLGRR
jgi:hypothetical protein